MGRSPEGLLSGAIQTAKRLQHELAAAHRVIPGVVLSAPHSSIAGTYARKFLSAQTGDYLSGLGQGWAGPAERRWIRESLTGLGSVLAPLLRSIPSQVVIYGDLKPEHVLLEPTGWQIWIDPGLQPADLAAELAKLVSRTALLLVTAVPSCAQITAIINALDHLVTEHLAHHELAEPSRLRRLMALWLADWANYLATGLSLAPNVGLPLPLTLLAAAAQARPLLALATDIAAHLVTDPAHAWAVALHGCGQLAYAANGEIR